MLVWFYVALSTVVSGVIFVFLMCILRQTNNLMQVVKYKSAEIAERIGTAKMLLIAIIISGFARVSIPDTHNSILRFDWTSCDAIMPNESHKHLALKIELDVFECRSPGWKLRITGYFYRL